MSIRLSMQHGVNPAIPKCFFCNDDKNMIILAGQLPGDKEAPSGMVWDMEPCDNCKEFMRVGIILISIDEVKSAGDTKNPWRTGGWIVVRQEAFERWPINPPELKAKILTERVAFIPDDAWDALGLPRGAVEGVPGSPEEYRRGNP